MTIAKENKTAHVTMAFDGTVYPFLSKYAVPMKKPSRPVVGREREMRRLLASLNRAELSNAFLLGDAGSGKTMLVQGASVIDNRRIYVEVDLAKMAASESGEDGTVQMASRLKGLFDDAIRYKQDVAQSLAEKDGVSATASQREVVLFIDEFHLLVQLSTAAAQAIKPILAESGRLGVKIIAATTFAEFHEYVESDQALMQRLQRINIRAPEKSVVLSILTSIAKSHDVYHAIYDKQLFELIYEYSNRYIPADSQPRKSILMLDSMIGWYRTYPTEYKMDRHLLADVIYDNTGIRVAFNVDGRSIYRGLTSRVFSQNYAARMIENRLQIAVADMHDKNRPISSFLFTGSTGVGKTEMAKALSELLFGDERAMIRFDMSEYALDSSLDRFREELSSRVWDKSHSVLLFDEVEKASPVVTRLMLQVLDDGRLTNRQGREVSFLNTYIILTTNAGSEIYKSIAHYNVADVENESDDKLKDYNKVIRRSLLNDKSFAPEIINRMNAIIPFQPLDRGTYMQIAERRLIKIKEEVKRIHGINLHILEPETVKRYLVVERFDNDTNSGGARGLVAQFDVEIVAPLSRYINDHKSHLKDIGLKVNGEMACDNRSLLKSNASIDIGTIKMDAIKRKGGLHRFTS